MKRREYTVHTADDAAFAGATHDEMVQYIGTRDPKHVAEFASDAVRFKYRRLTRSQRLYAESAPEDVLKWERAFQCGIMSISGGEFGEEIDGGDTWAPEARADQSFTQMSPDELDYVEEIIGPAAVVDIGAVIYTRSWLRPKAVPLYPAPPMSLRAWAGRQRLYAEQSPADAPQNKEEPRHAQG